MVVPHILVVVITLACVVAGCSETVHRTTLRAPNPNGCYAIVYEQPVFGGAADLLNGPARHASLKRLIETNEETWHRRIRSVRVGRMATVTLFAEPNFAGESHQFGASTEHASIPSSLSGRAQSLQIACLSASEAP